MNINRLMQIANTAEGEGDDYIMVENFDDQFDPIFI